MNEPEPLEFTGPNEVRFQGRTLLYFSGCDYFRLARHPRVAKAAVSSLKKHGLSVAASRRTTGNHKIYSQLEAALAKFFGSETAVVLPDGYFAPIAVAQALEGEHTHVLVDELAHGALLDAARMLNRPVKRFKHRDPQALAESVSECGKGSRPIVLTDGLFAHDGSVAPLREYLKILPSNGRILVDDAHGAGILGVTGKGALEHEGMSRRRIIQCGTLSKAFGAYGGIVLASRAVRKKVWARSWAFMGATPLPLPLAGAALAALKILQSEPGRRKRLFENTAYLRKHLRAAGWNVSDTPGPIVRLPVMNDTEIRRWRGRLLAAGIYPPFLKYGNASADGFFRFVVSSEHTRVHLDKVVAALTR